MNDDLQIFYGEAVKALDDSGRVGGYLVKFGSPGERDLHGEFFDAKGYYGPTDGDGAEAIFEHGFPVVSETAPKATQAFHKSLSERTFQPLKTRRDEIGIWAETVLDIADEYEKAVYSLVKAGKLGWSSGAPGHRVKIAEDGRISRWPIAEGSLTPRPANPRSRAISLKSWQAERVEEISLTAQPDGNFERELAAKTHNVPDLWETFSKCVVDIAEAASMADVTGVPVDVDGLLTREANGFFKSLVPVLAGQIAEYLARDSNESFFVKGAHAPRVRELITKSIAASRDSLLEHSKAAASAADEFASETSVLAKSIEDYAGRAERKLDFRVKEGRELSTVNVEYILSTAESLDAAKSALDGASTRLRALAARARRQSDESMAADVKAGELRAKWMRMQAAELGIECAA